MGENNSKEGEINFLDRSWYTRAITEPVMGYCTEDQYRDFMEKVTNWEEELIYSGVEIIKFYFSLSQDQQKRRMKARKNLNLSIGSFPLMMKGLLQSGMLLHSIKNKCLIKPLLIFHRGL